MKNRRIAIIAFVLVAVMAIGIGYATLNDTITIDGTAKAGDGASIDEYVYIESASVTTSKGADVTATVNPATKPDNFTFSLNADNLTVVGDTATATVTVVNDGDIDVWVEEITATYTNDEYFGVTIDKVDGTEYKLANTNGEFTIVITIRLDKTPAAEVTSDIDVEINVTTDAGTTATVSTTAN